MDEIGLPFPKEDEIEPKIPAMQVPRRSMKLQIKGFKPPVDHDVPNGKYGEHPIDRFIRQKLDKENLPLNPLATDYEILRRASYDLVGLPPSVELVEEYLNDNSPNKFDKLVESLLASPHYGEKWGRHWLDLVRYAETNGYERDGDKPQAWRYRDYVIKSFNENKPYDQFVTEQLAGDEILNASADAITATGFHRLGIWDDEPADRVLARYDYLDDIVRTTTEVFLGMTVGCARCHDHKIDPIPTKDYYSMLAFFANITPHGKGDSNLVEVKDSIGNITYQKEIGNWTGRKNELQRNIVDFENTFLANYEKDKSITKTNKVRAKPVIILQDARDKGSQWRYLERKPSPDWIEVGYNDQDWESGYGGFGTKGTPGSHVRTVWKR